MAKKSKPSYYAVKIGRTPGIYKTWPECKNEVLYFSGARYKGFNDLEEAHNYLVVPFPAPANTNAQIHDGNDAESAEVDEHDGYTLKRKVESLQSDPEFPKKHKAEASPSQSAGVEAPKELLSAGIFGSKAVVYTDGACTDNGRGNAQAGCGVYWGAGSPLLVTRSFGVSTADKLTSNLAEKVPGPNQTNNRGEMMAFIRALERCPADIKLLNIYSDSEYTINCASGLLLLYSSHTEQRSHQIQSGV